MADITTQNAKFGDTDNTLLLKATTAMQAISAGGAFGSAAYLSVGTTPGTVMAGNDARLLALYEGRIIKGRTTALSISSATVGATLTADPSFTQAVVAGETWGIDLFLFVDQTTANASFKAKIVTPALTFGNKDLIYSRHSSGTVANSPFESGVAFTDNIITNGAGVEKYALRVRGVLKASASGNLELQIAQYAAHANPTTVIGYWNLDRIGIA